ncbi:MAG TPA: bifunctional glutamate N-acetyltransferase/amino-acid acetyltransferase ArgJ [Thermoplasmata archaeon]|nr:bifunctional glutamate N-acetyltransferase/amino-acid acetyltransferase ArgJ [Thermoplasmata archaeon]
MSGTRLGVTSLKGFRAGGVSCGVKRSGRPDLSIVLTDLDATAAGVFTTNQCKAAPVLLGAERLQRAATGVRGILTVSGVANALTGAEGLSDNRQILSAAEETFGLPPESLLPACTGVIGPRIPVPLVRAGLPPLRAATSGDAEGGDRAANAILTTDTCPKQAAVRARLADGRVIHVGGMAKGSGMIAPRLAPLHATTLAFLTTDAPVPPAALERLLVAESDRTLNMVCVDGDTSTNDTIYLLANGAVGGPSAEGDPALQRAVGEVLERLSRAIARDGEGATKLLTVHVEGARTVPEARAAARSVVGSTLVKAAVFGADPNVGRIACAVGYSGAHVDPDQIDVALCSAGRRVPLIVDGRPAPGLDNGGGQRVRQLLRQMEEVPLSIQLHQGGARATAWGCDLSYAYVQINAQYRT